MKKLSSFVFNFIRGKINPRRRKVLHHKSIAQPFSNLDNFRYGELSHSNMRKGITLLEVAGVITIGAILTFFAVKSYNGSVDKARRDQVVNDLSVYATQIGEAFYDKGFDTLDPTVPADVSKMKSLLAVLQQDYTGLKFDIDGLQTIRGKGFSVNVSSPLSPYGTPYVCYFNTQGDKAMLMSCAGKDGKNEDPKTLFNASNEYTSDDIVLIVKPK